MPGADMAGSAGAGGMGAGSYASMAANVVGGTMQAIAAWEAQQAMEKEIQNEIKQQSGLSQQGYRQFLAGLDSYGADAAQAQMQQGAAQRMGMYNQLASAPLTLNGTPSKTTAADNSILNQIANARANYGSISDWQVNQMINQIKQQEQLNQISNFARGFASTYPSRMTSAQHSADVLYNIGGDIKSFGGITGGAIGVAQQGQSGGAQPMYWNSQNPGMSQQEWNWNMNSGL